MDAFFATDDNPIKDHHLAPVLGINEQRSPHAHRHTEPNHGYHTNAPNYISFGDHSSGISSSASSSKRRYYQEKKNTLYKTEICRLFEDNGFCQFGDDCIFAHGSSELRPLPKHPKYKTEICRAFWELGQCSYGKRCNFLHVAGHAGDSGDHHPANATLMGYPDNQDQFYRRSM